MITAALGVASFFTNEVPRFKVQSLFRLGRSSIEILGVGRFTPEGAVVGWNLKGIPDARLARILAEGPN